VQHLSGSHTLLLNKFNVVPHHVLVVTRAFESQADPLNSSDLGATQQVCAVVCAPHAPPTGADCRHWWQLARGAAGEDECGWRRSS
jgi:hypothetical protein